MTRKKQDCPCPWPCWRRRRVSHVPHSPPRILLLFVLVLLLLLVTAAMTYATKDHQQSMSPAGIVSVPLHPTASLWQFNDKKNNDDDDNDNDRRRQRRMLWNEWKSEYEYQRRWSRYTRYLMEQENDNSTTTTTTTTTTTAAALQTPLYHGIGTHFVYLWVGSPEPQRVSLIVDTGSHKTAFPCVGCQDCGATYHTDPHFDALQSTTFHRFDSCNECRFDAQCHASPHWTQGPSSNSSDTTNATSTATTTKSASCILQQTYTEHSSWTAFQATDIVSLGNVEQKSQSPREAFSFTFGCQVSVTGRLFVEQLADGIAGFSLRHSNSNNDGGGGGDTLPQQMYQAGLLRKPKFSLCFQGLESQKKNDTKEEDPVLTASQQYGGMLTLGGTIRERHATPMVFARNIHGTSQGNYAVKVKRVYFRFGTNDQPPQPFPASGLSDLNRGRGVIVDSGTTDSYFPPSLGFLFQKYAWKAAHEYSDKQEMQLTADEIKELPTLVLQVEAAFSSKPLDKNTTGDGIPGYAGTLLDPLAPLDVLIEITPDAYMEYDSDKETYMGRLHFDETRGGAVLGANALQGYDVLFSSTKLGFAKSSCQWQPNNNDDDDDNSTIRWELNNDDDDLVPAGEGGEQEDNDKNAAANGNQVTDAMGIVFLSLVTLVFVACMIYGLVARYRRYWRIKTGMTERPSTREYLKLDAMDDDQEELQRDASAFRHEADDDDDDEDYKGVYNSDNNDTDDDDDDDSFGVLLMDSGGNMDSDDGDVELSEMETTTTTVNR